MKVFEVWLYILSKKKTVRVDYDECFRTLDSWGQVNSIQMKLEEFLKLKLKRLKLWKEKF